MFQKCIYSTLTLLWFVAATAHASIIVPTGLNPGDTYHLAFVTRDARTAMDTDITVYNAFVQAQAALNPSLTGTDMGVTWTAIASTKNTDARDNAFVEAPVFLLDGTTKIADGFSDMWITYHTAHINWTQFGVAPSRPYVWSGSGNHGYGWMELGDPVRTMWGLTDGALYGWLSYSYTKADKWALLPLYALSEKLTVPTLVDPIPEPASFVVWLGLASVLGVGTRLRRRFGRRV